FLSFFFFTETATSVISPLSLHDALPICEQGSVVRGGDHDRGTSFGSIRNVVPIPTVGPGGVPVEPDGGPGDHGRLIRRQDRGPWTEDAVRRARTIRRPGGRGDLRRGKLGLDEEELPVVRRFAAPAVRHREEADVPPRDRVGMGRDRPDRGRIVAEA